jgi:hypothetical protein
MTVSVPTFLLMIVISNLSNISFSSALHLISSNSFPLFLSSVFIYRDRPICEFIERRRWRGQQSRQPSKLVWHSLFAHMTKTLIPITMFLLHASYQLLGWMHRKLRQNNNDVFKEFTASGGTSINLVWFFITTFLHEKKSPI